MFFDTAGTFFEAVGMFLDTVETWILFVDAGRDAAIPFFFKSTLVLFDASLFFEKVDILVFFWNLILFTSLLIVLLLLLLLIPLLLWSLLLSLLLEMTALGAGTVFGGSREPSFGIRVFEFFIDGFVLLVVIVGLVPSFLFKDMFGYH